LYDLINFALFEALSYDFLLLLSTDAPHFPRARRRQPRAPARVKVLYLSPCAQLGGAEQSLLELLAGIRSSDPRCELKLLANADGPLLARAQALDVATEIVAMPPSLARLGDSPLAGRAGALGLAKTGTRLGASLPLAAAYLIRLSRAIRQFAPAIVHTNGFKMHILGVLASPRGTPVVWHVHDYVNSRPLMRHLMRTLSARCRYAITNSDDVAEDLRKACGQELRIRRVYYSVDSQTFAPAGASLDLDRLAGLPPAPPETVRVGLVATMAKWKGHRIFLRALSELPPKMPVRGYIVGGPIYQTQGSQQTLAELQEFAEQLGLRGKVGFTGFLEQTAPTMRALDVIVHASTAPEPFGRVIAEAMACGRPVVASRAGGAVELIREEEDALSFAPGDSSQLASQIGRLAADPALRRRLGHSSRSAAVKRFDRRRYTDEIRSVYQTVLECG
jgi:glycosyltransferase involved in cell wall biosynthesis